MTAPRRRWSFSLRTLFVVMTAFAAWISWERHTSMKRQEIRVFVGDKGGTFAHGDRYRFNVFDDWQEWGIYLPEGVFSDEDAGRIKRAFPEGSVYVKDAAGNLHQR